MTIGENLDSGHFVLETQYNSTVHCTMNIDHNHHPQCDIMYDVSPELQDIGLEEESQFDDRPPSQPRMDTQLDVAVEHDQLPSVEEHKASQQVTAGGSSRQYRKMGIVLAIGIIVASIFITIGVAIGKNGDEYGYSPEKIKTNAEESIRVKEIISMITTMGWAETDRDWEDHSSPQRKAVSWLATGDPKNMKVDVTEEFMNRYLLATLYYAFDGNNWAYDLEWLSVNTVCEWQKYFETKEGIPIEVGVSCHDSGHIKEIFLPQMNMKGSIPHEIGLLLDLEDLNLFGNKLQRTLPDSMKNLKALEVLILHNNELSGTLPKWITTLTNLKTINLAENEFGGFLPSNMGTALTSLETLVLESNMFESMLDPLLHAKRLTALYLGNNNFQGELSTELLQSWSSIKILDLSSNSLTGSLPAFLFATDTLYVVDLHANHLTGALPTSLEAGSTIEFLALQQNQLTGTIGRQFESFSNLAHLDLSINLFNGDMPTSLGMIKTLKYLYVAFNSNFNIGPIPVEYATLPNLVDLSLQSTGRSGTIPYQFEGLSKLVLFDLNDNFLSGGIPYQVGEMTSLQHLLLKNNNLNGTIPATFQDLQLLNTLLLDHNVLTPSYENVCDPSLPKIKIFTADCRSVGACSCCTTCCLPTDTACNNATWFSDVDPIANNGYVRDSYFFKESDIIFPAPRNVIPNYYKNFSGYYSNSP